MKFKLIALIVTLAVVISAFGVGSQPSPAKAQVDNAEAAYVTCKEFGVAGYFSSVSGTPKKVGIYVYNITTGTELAFKFIAGPSTGGSYGGSVQFAEQPAHSQFYVDVSTYPESGSDFFDWDGEFYLSGVVDCSDSGFNGPSIPSGAELKTINCDVAVFDAPGGQPVGDNRIKSGQTWYVLPGATADAKGEKWVQVFVSGFGLPWIPARCVPGADTGAKPVRTAASSGSVLTASNTQKLTPANTPH